jgi:aminoglycoside phosphotransferase family enzyme
MRHDIPMHEHARLVAALRNPAAYAHPVGEVGVVETHISTVLLAGDYAYKLKKPVSLGFADFSTPALRRHFCEEELRINRRTAPALYLDVQDVVGTPRQAHVVPAGAGAARPVLDAVLRMRRFDQAKLLDHLARSDALTARQVDGLAAGLVHFHALAAPAPSASPHGSAALIRRWSDASLAQLRGCLEDGAERAALHRLDGALGGEFERRAAAMARRREQGFVRECHGDLHLGNLVMLDGEAVPFDAIEFNDELRWIDVMSDVAFVFMDLLAHGQARLGWRLLGRWLQGSGDYGGVPVLRYYAAYRALVRAQVAAIRAAQAPAAEAAAQARAGTALHLALARELLAAPAPVVVAMSGLSGSGKSVVAQSLAEQCGACARMWNASACSAWPPPHAGRRTSCTRRRPPRAPTRACMRWCAAAWTAASAWWWTRPRCAARSASRCVNWPRRWMPASTWWCAMRRCRCCANGSPRGRRGARTPRTPTSRC